jgi:hypothetical protein
MLCIAIAPIPLLQKLALFCGFWVLSIVMSAMVLIPIMVQYFPVPKNLAKIARPEKTNFMEKRVLGGFATMATGKPAYVVVGLGVVTFVLAIWITSKMNIGDIHPGSPILWPESVYNVGIKNINENFAGTEDPAEDPGMPDLHGAERGGGLLPVDCGLRPGGQQDHPRGGSEMGSDSGRRRDDGQCHERRHRRVSPGRFRPDDEPGPQRCEHRYLV